MTEDINTIQKTKDKNLREAIMQEEMTRPPLPSDINARLMKRVAKEENRKRSLRLGWPWIAAACLAVVITVVLPHTRSANDTSASEKHETIVKTKKAQKRETVIPKEEKVIATQEKTITETAKAIANDENSQQLVADIDMTASCMPEHKKAIAAHNDSTMAQSQNSEEEETAADTQPFNCDLAKANEKQPQSQPKTLTERDIPITRAENLKYTEAEIALMKKQANEAYLKWVELELEIAKFHLEQTANK